MSKQLKCLLSFFLSFSHTFQNNSEREQRSICKSFINSARLNKKTRDAVCKWRWNYMFYFHMSKVTLVIERISLTGEKKNLLLNIREATISCFTQLHWLHSFNIYTYLSSVIKCCWGKENLYMCRVYTERY